jgi:hypothetical protein
MGRPKFGRAATFRTGQERWGIDGDDTEDSSRLVRAADVTYRLQYQLAGNGGGN